MRYYKIVVGSKTFTSWDGSKNLPGALNVELDVPVFEFATPKGAAYVKIWGVSLQDIGQASDLNNQPISIYGGFQNGLPLANSIADKNGLLVQGYVLQAFGNWIGLEQSLDLIVYPNTGTTDDPKNFTFTWKKGTSLSDMIKTTLKTALPNYTTVNVNIGSNLVLPADEPGFYGTLTQFAQYVKDVSQQINADPNYSGVEIAVTETTINVYDGSTQSDPIQLAFQDLIGQPTWRNPLSIQAKFAMRADIHVGDYIKFPPALVTTGVGTTSPFGPSAKSVFQGVFKVGDVRHVGNFRQPDAASWVTVVDAYAAQAAN